MSAKVTIFLVFCLVYQALSYCTVVQNGFDCFDSFGDEVESIVPGYGFCTRDCGNHKYCSPLNAICDGDTGTFTPGLEELQCVDSTVLVVSGGSLEPDSISVLTSQGLCDPGLTMPDPRDWHSMTFDSDNVGYICGGDTLYSKACYKRNFTDTGSTWTSLPKMDLGRKHHASVVHKNKLYVIGGQDVSSGRPLGNIAFLDMSKTPMQWDFDSFPNLPSNIQLVGMCAVVVEDNLYVIGGLGGDMKNIFQFNLDLKTYQTRAEMQIGRENHACAVLDGAIFITGGNEHLGGNPSYEPYASVERYDPGFASTVFLPDMTAPRTQHAMGIVDGKLTVFGGSNQDSNPLMHAERFNVVLDRWEKMPNIGMKNETSRISGGGNIPITLFPNCLN